MPTRSAPVPTTRVLGGFGLLSLPALVSNFVGLLRLVTPRLEADDPLHLIHGVAAAVSITGMVMLGRRTDLTPPLRQWVRPSLGWVAVLGTVYSWLMWALVIGIGVHEVMGDPAMIPLLAVVMVGAYLADRHFKLTEAMRRAEHFRPVRYRRALFTTYWMLLWGAGQSVSTILLAALLDEPGLALYAIPGALSLWCLVTLHYYGDGYGDEIGVDPATDAALGAPPPQQRSWGRLPAVVARTRVGGDRAVASRRDMLRRFRGLRERLNSRPRPDGRRRTGRRREPWRRTRQE